MALKGRHNKSGLLGTAVRTLAVTGIAAAAGKFLRKRQAGHRAAERQAYSRAAGESYAVPSH